MQLAAVAMVAGGLLTAKSRFEQGQAASASANSAAGQLDSAARRYNSAASDQEATGQRKAAEIKRQNRLIQSKVIARNAAAGGSSLDKNTSDLLIDLEGEGEYAALNALYEGSDRADNLRNQAIGLSNKANVARYEGRQARKAANIGALSSILQSGGQAATFYSKYNNPAPTDYNSNAESGLSYGSLYGDY